MCHLKIAGFIQVHAINWDGATDTSLKPLEGREAVCMTIDTMRSVAGVDEIFLVTTTAPEDDIYECIAQQAGVSLFRGSPHDVLQRLQDAMAFSEADAAVLAMGMHPFFNPQLAGEMLTCLLEGGCDLVHPPDWFPTPFGCSVFQREALNKADFLLSERKDRGEDVRASQVRPLTFIRENAGQFRVKCYDSIPEYTLKALQDIRERAKPLHEDEAPALIMDKAYAPGSFQTARYRFAIAHLPKPGHVLDIACGNGSGTAMLSEACGSAIGGDIDERFVKHNPHYWRNVPNLSFQYADAMALPFPDAMFDGVVSMETIEHVPDMNRFASEMRRVLKPGGVFVCSTPQSVPPYGDAPYIHWHLKELSAPEFRNILERHFPEVRIHGVLNGTIRPAGQEAGNSMIAVCRI